MDGEKAEAKSKLRGPIYDLNDCDSFGNNIFRALTLLHVTCERSEGEKSGAAPTYNVKRFCE